MYLGMQATSPTLRSSLFRPGQRIAVAVSGGSDSVALLRRLLEERNQLSVELSVLHVHHGIRGTAADEDAEFVSSLARSFDLPCQLHHANAPRAAQELGETLEEAARNLRYAFFREWMAAGQADAVVTAHTLDDQAETVLHKLIRGAWTEGLSGIHPVLQVEGGVVLRPFLDNQHTVLQAWLRSLAQPWREDLSNEDLAHTRNRIRLQLLPLLRSFNPQIATQLARLATIAADEEVYWQKELTRLLPSLLLPGRPVRGGGRSSSTHPAEDTVAIEQVRLRELPPAVARRVVRAAGRQIGARLNFEQTEQVLGLLTGSGTRGGKFDLPGQVRVERSLREIRLSRVSGGLEPAPRYSFVVPGEVVAPAFGVALRGNREGESAPAVLRVWGPGDRVMLRHGRAPKKVADVLDRLGITGEERKKWPVVEAGGAIVWMRGVDVDAPGVRFSMEVLPDTGARDQGTG